MVIVREPEWDRWLCGTSEGVSTVGNAPHWLRVFCADGLSILISIDKQCLLYKGNVPQSVTLGWTMPT